MITALVLTSSLAIGDAAASPGPATPLQDPAQTDAAPEDPAVRAAARAALAPVAERMDGVLYLRAHFVQEQESLLLDEPIVTRGDLLLRAEPGTVVLEIEGDRPVRVRSDATSHLVHHVAARRAERWLFERNEVAAALLACLGADVERLETVFRARSVTALEADEDEELPARTVVRLEPRDERVAAVVAELEIVIDPEAKVVLEVRHANPDGERVRLRLTDVELDPEDWEDPGADFDERLPEGTDVRTRRVPVPKGD